MREQTHSFLIGLPNEPPRPGNSLYSCIESEHSEESEIREVAFLGAGPENKMIKQVNSKQYFRMMKRRIKKGMQKVLKGRADEPEPSKKKYMHESRHQHAVTRVRGKDGKFIASNAITIQLGHPRNVFGRRKSAVGSPRVSGRKNSKE
jgi:hypothetical protein